MKKRTFITVVLIVWLMIVAVSPVRAQGSGYSILDLGTLGGSSSYVSAINDRGQVVGYSETSSGETHAFLWKKGTMTDLGTLGGGASEAADINKFGQVVGWSTLASGERHAFLWEKGRMTDLGTLSGNDSYAVDINDNGQVAGTATLSPLSND